MWNLIWDEQVITVGLGKNANLGKICVGKEGGGKEEKSMGGKFVVLSKKSYPI